MPSKDNTVVDRFSDLPVEVTVAVGRARPSLGDLIQLAPNAVIPLDRQVDDPVEILIGERVIARGQLEESDINGRRQLLVRLTEVRQFDADD